MGQGLGAANAAQQSAGYANGPPKGTNTAQYAPINYGYAHGGEVSDDETRAAAMRLMNSGKYDEKNEKENLVPGPEHGVDIYKGKDDKQHVGYDVMAAHGGEMCYAQGGEIHDHELCMRAGGTVPGEAQVPGDSTQNDTIHARLSPHEIVLPRTIAQAPNAPQAAAQFVGGIKGQPTPLDFSAILKQLEDNGIEMRLCPKGY